MKPTACILGVAVACACFGCDGRNGPDVEPRFTIDGAAVPLEDGSYRGENGTVSLAASVTGDLNDDGRDDLAAVLVLDSRGSGVFYYLNVFLDDGQGGWRFAGEEFLGDRIRYDFMSIYGEGSKSQLTGVAIHPDDFGKLVMAFYIHGREQAFADEPSVFIARHWAVVDGSLTLIEDY